MKIFNLFSRNLFILGATLTMIMAAQQSYAQKNKEIVSLGGTMSLMAGENYTGFAVGPKLQFKVANWLRLGPEFLLFKNDYLDFGDSWDLNLNFHFLIRTSDRSRFYPIVGAGLRHVVGSTTIWGGYNYSYSRNEFVCNSGFGMEFDVTRHFRLGLEAKCYLETESALTANFLLGIGAAYVF